MRPLYYDTETTGIRSDEDRIIEIAIFDPEQDRTYEQLINPGMPIPPESTAIHNITDEMVATSPSFKEIAPDLIEFCSGDVVLIAHNNDAFDKHFLKAEFERNKVEMPEWPMIDSLKWSRKYRPDLPRHALQYLRELHDIPANNAHRALDDVIVLHKVFSEMVDDLSMETIHSLLNRKETIKHMPFGKYRGKPLSAVPKSYVTYLLGQGAFDKPDNAALKEAFIASGHIPQ